MKKVLFAGESWISYSRHIKGFDSFFTAKYEEGIQWIKKSIEKAGYEFCYISNTYAAENQKICRRRRKFVHDWWLYVIYWN